MDVVGASVLIFAPLTLLGVTVSLLAGYYAAAGVTAPRALMRVGRGAVIVLWLLGLALVPVAGFGDWVHLFWATQVPLVGLFLCSGLLRRDAVGLASDGSSRSSAGTRDPSRASRLRGLVSASSLFFMVATLSLAPLVLVTLFPEEHPATRPVGTPARGLWELVAWGFGGSLPSFLAPATSVAEARGVDYLPRVLTVPFGTTLIAAWLWIVFAALTWITRWVRAPRVRALLGFVSAPALGAVAFVDALLGLELGPLDPRFFFPTAARRSGIWESDPTVMRSYGPVLLAALVVLVVLVWVEWRSRARTTSEPPRGD